MLDPFPLGRPGITRARVSILSHDLSINCAARGVLLETLLAPALEVRLLGPRFGGGVFAPFADRVDAAAAVPGRRFPRFVGTRRRLEALADGDVMFALKPRYASFGVALRIARRRGIPLVLDVDDDESALFEGVPNGRIRSLVSYRNPNGASWTRRLERQVHLADAVTAGSPSLARQYGGVFVPYAVDTRVFDPCLYSTAMERRRLGFTGKFLIVFCGSPKPHKGLDLLARIVGGLDDCDAHLLVVGGDAQGVYERGLTALGRGRVTIRPPMPRSEVPALLAAASAVVLPQRDSRYARMQLPAKLVDAMSMGRAIIASRVSDLPDVLNGSGILVPPEDGGALAEAIRYLARRPVEAAALGERARRICQARFDEGFVRDRLLGVFHPLLHRNPRRISESL